MRKSERATKKARKDGPCVPILGCLSLVQFLIIAALIMHPSRLQEIWNEKSGSLVPVPPHKSNPQPHDKAIGSRNDEDTKILSGGVNHNGSFAPDGVAVTLMLHSPKWFQRRYTLMVLNTLNNIPSTWVLQIFYTAEGQSQAGIDLNKGLQRLISQKKVILTRIPEDVLRLRKKRILLLTHQWFWDSLLADRVLIFGGNQVMCGNSPLVLADFDKWDYVGSPTTSFHGLGGNGGISLRSRPAMKAVIQYRLDQLGPPESPKRVKGALSFGQEDTFFIKAMDEMNQKGVLFKSDPENTGPAGRAFRIAPVEETRRFAAGDSFANDGVLAASGTLPDAPYDERETFLSYCPELKMIFPSLHEPNCFGAKPNPHKCAAAVCATRPLVGGVRRRGGC